MARTIADGKSLGSDPDARLQVIAREDIIRVTRLAVERTDTPPRAVNCCHPRVWSKRELAEETHRRLSTGTVNFERKEGGLEESAYADGSRMLEWFGPPRVPLDTVIDRAVRLDEQ